MNKFDQVNRVANQVREAYGQRYTTKQAIMSEIIKIRCSIADIEVDRRRTRSEQGPAVQEIAELEKRLEQASAKRQPTLEELFRGVMRR